MTDRSPYCCEGMRFGIEDAGHGLFVVVRNPEDPRLRQYARSRDGTLWAQTALRFCPACGRLTDELILEHREFYTRLAREHEERFPGGAM